MHQEVMRAIRVVLGGVQYVALGCDDFFIVNNQSWLFICYYVVQNWVRIPILIFLNIVLKGLGSDNLTKVIMEALTIGGGLLGNQIAQKLICFGAYGVNVFQGTKNGVTKHIHDTYAPHSTGVHCMAH
jgi:hypothetical protein